jgi:hypothetical protein
MTIWFQCPNGHYLGVDQRYAGRRVRCGGCGKLVYVPGRPAQAKRKAAPEREPLPPAKSAAIPSAAKPVPKEEVEASAAPPAAMASAQPVAEPVVAPPHPGPLPEGEGEQSGTVRVAVPLHPQEMAAAPLAAPPHPGHLPVGEEDRSAISPQPGHPLVVAVEAMATPTVAPPHPSPLPMGEGDLAHPSPLPVGEGENAQQSVRRPRMPGEATAPSLWATVSDYWLRRTPRRLPAGVERLDHEKLRMSYVLAAGLSLVVLLSVAPAVLRGNINLAVAPGWARAVFLAAGLQLVYIFWTLNAPDWASARVTAVIFSLAAAFYAAVLAIAMFTPADHPMPLGFGGDRRMAVLLSGAELVLAALGAGLAGWVSVRLRGDDWRQSGRRVPL